MTTTTTYKPNQPRTTILVSIDRLFFDPDNPRLPPKTVDEKMADGKKEQEILKWMLEEGTLPELMVAIGEQGYFGGEPLLVVPHEKKKECYIVIEGNRRLAALKLLKEPSRAPIRPQTVQKISESARSKPEEVPVLEFAKRDDILFYLGYRHVTGIKAWDPLAKARYLEQLADKTDGPYSQRKFQSLARSIGSHWDYVAKLLAGLEMYKLMEEHRFFEIADLDGTTIDFAVLTTALGYPDIVSFLGLESSTDPALKGLKSARLKELAQWLFEKDEFEQTRLVESRNLKILNRIVSSDAALRAFRAGASIKQAERLTGSNALDVFEKAIRDARSALETAREQTLLISSFDKSSYDALDYIGKMAHQLRDWVGPKIIST